MKVNRPAARPCGTCPYRRDVPSGVWAAEEYEKLPGYDAETWAQPAGIFVCHQQDGRLCAGWVAVHDMHESLGLRLAAAAGTIEPDTVRDVWRYTTDVPLFGSGAEAAEHGLREVARPGHGARAAITRLQRKRA